MTTRTRPRGFAPWQPRAETRALLEDVQGVLEEYADHLPLTIRQVFYRLVAQTGFDKTETAYARLCEALNRARRAGFIPFGAIRDDGTTRVDPCTWVDDEDFLESFKAAAERFQLDRQAGQRTRLWLITEAAGMSPMISRVANPFGVPVLSSGGFDSLTGKHGLACELANADAPAEVLHIGDRDPSGEHLFASLAEDVTAMVAAFGGHPPTFTRLAVTLAQIEAFALPTAPPKPTDRRAFEGRTVQAEAIAPDVLIGIVRAAIESRRSAAVAAEVLSREVNMRGDLLRRLG